MNRAIKVISTIVLFTVISFNFCSKVWAAFTMSLQDLSDTNVNTSEQEIQANASISGLPSESYFRIAFQQSSGQPYFGYMKNNAGDWAKITASQDCHNFLKISDASASALSLIVKIGDDNSIDNGNYTLKLRRYTASCSSYSDSNAVFIVINLPTSVPTSAPTANPTPTPTPVKTSTPTVAPTHTPIPTKSPAPTPTATSEGIVLGEETVFPSPQMSAPVINLTAGPKIKFPVSAIGLVVIGVGLIGFSVISIIKRVKKSYTIESGKENNQIS